MSANPVQQLDIYGPDRCEVLTPDAARAFCRRLVRGRDENFSVLSSLVPRSRRDDFAAVYAFCRWADDLGDEIHDPERSLELLAWWRRELEQCYAGEPRHPVFIALKPTIEAFDLPMQHFDDLIRAFEQDQRVTRYETWDQLLHYCSLSANPVGRLVLLMLEQEPTATRLDRSDDICTALQLTNHWQDVARDILERDRIYIPSEFITIDRFEERLIGSARQGYAVDRTFLDESRQVLRTLVERTWPLYERGDELVGQVDRSAQPVVWLLAAGGQHVLHQIELWNFETVLHRPRLSRVTKIALVIMAIARRTLGRFNGASSSL